MRDTERSWAATVEGFGELLKPGRTGSLEGFMGVAEQIDKYRKRLAIVRAGRRLRGRGPEPAAGAVRLRRHPLGHDPAAADARLAPGARDPGRDPLGAEADQGLRALAADRRGAADLIDRPQALGRLPPRRRGAARAHRRARPGDRGGRDPRLLPHLRRARGQDALRRQDAGLRQGDAPDPARAARGALHPHHPRRPRRLALAHADELGAGDLRGVGAPVAQPDPQGAQDGADDRPLHRGPLRGPGRRHRGRAAQASATSSSSTSTR